MDTRLSIIIMRRRKRRRRGGTGSLLSAEPLIGSPVVEREHGEPMRHEEDKAPELMHDLTHPSGARVSQPVGHQLPDNSVVVESLCLESESRLESPVSESESSPSHSKKIRVESESSPLLIRVKSESSPY